MYVGNYSTYFIDILGVFLYVFQVGVVDGIKPPRAAVRALYRGDLLSCVCDERHSRLWPGSFLVISSLTPRYWQLRPQYKELRRSLEWMDGKSEELFIYLWEAVRRRDLFMLYKVSCDQLTGSLSLTGQPPGPPASSRHTEVRYRQLY